MIQSIRKTAFERTNNSNKKYFLKKFLHSILNKKKMESHHGIFNIDTSICASFQTDDVA